MLKELCRIALWSSYELVGGSMVRFSKVMGQDSVELLALDGTVIGGLWYYRGEFYGWDEIWEY